MNPYETLVQQVNEQPQPQKVAVGLDTFNNVDVAENIGHAKLKKKPYNPYSLVVAPEPGTALEPRDNFRKEMLRDATE